MKIQIAKGNTKLGTAVATISLPPGKACGNCSGCKKDCYAKQPYIQYKQTKAAWDRNLKIYKKSPYLYFSQVHDYLIHYNPERFRWHTSGDILDQGYLNSMIDVSDAFPKTKFLCFTKMYWLHFPEKLPYNFKIVLSVWPGMAISKYPARQERLLRQFPAAYMLDKNNIDPRIPSTAKACSGSCANCERCWNLKPGEAVVFHKH